VITARPVLDVENGSRREITVMDSGPGVPESSLPFLFDPFYRVSESRDHDEGGTGLGLSIAQKITEVHHGTIEAMNRGEASGLAIRLLLPSA
jgi:signal transduction histidine kinase